MTAREVKRKLAEREIRQIDLAKKWKVSSATINKFVNREFTSARLDKRLAKLLDITVEELRGEINAEKKAS